MYFPSKFIVFIRLSTFHKFLKFIFFVSHRRGLSVANKDNLCQTPMFDMKILSHKHEDFLKITNGPEILIEARKTMDKLVECVYCMCM